MLKVKRDVDFCRDEDCDIEELHAAHGVGDKRRRRKLTSERSLSPRAPWERQDRQGLKESVLKAVGDLPTMIAWIARDVRDDYGQCDERTIYRYVASLVAEHRLVKVDLGLNFAAYLAPGARMLADREAIKDYMVGEATCFTNVGVKRRKLR